MSCIEALSALLSNYPCHSVLWKLYSVCRYLRGQKPSFSKRLPVVLYVCQRDDFYAGHSLLFEDGFYIDPFKNMFYMCYSLICYYIPKEWILKIFCYNKKWYINDEDFCCRLNVSYQGIMLREIGKSTVLFNRYIYVDTGHRLITDIDSCIYR